MFNWLPWRKKLTDIEPFDANSVGRLVKEYEQRLTSIAARLDAKLKEREAHMTHYDEQINNLTALREAATNKLEHLKALVGII